MRFTSSSDNERYMQRCLELALKGEGKTKPNPMVGAVLVYQNSIIGEGWHIAAGKPHAEVECIHSVKDDNKKFISLSTLFVNLEPCCHHGKTAPCTNFILNHKIKNVIIGTKDYSKKVNGKGIEILKHHGVNVKVGVLEKACQRLNRYFFISSINQIPYLILKWAESNDGFLSAGLDKKRVIFSNSLTNMYSHKLRSKVEAIMVGKKTFIHDKPQLNERYWRTKSPIRIIVDSNLETLSLALSQKSNSKTLIINHLKEGILEDKGQKVHLLNIGYQQENSFFQLLSTLFQQGINSLLVEGGATLLNYFLKHPKYIQEIHVIKAKKICLLKGISSPIIQHFLPTSHFSLKEYRFSDNIINYYQRKISDNIS